ERNDAPRERAPEPAEEGSGPHGVESPGQRPGHAFPKRLGTERLREPRSHRAAPLEAPRQLIDLALRDGREDLNLLLHPSRVDDLLRDPADPWGARRFVTRPGGAGVPRGIASGRSRLAIDLLVEPAAVDLDLPGVVGEPDPPAGLVDESIDRPG